MVEKPGLSYEILTQAIFQEILNQSEITNVSVQHDVVLQGKTLQHQIDIFWKLRIAGVEYETVVQAKDWSTPVNQGQLLQFNSVLEDLPGQPKGIFVTRTGYQEGARKYALAHGILLYELREADYSPPMTLSEFGWARIKLVSMLLHGAINASIDRKQLWAFGFDTDIYTPRYSDIRFSYDGAWLSQRYPAGNPAENLVGLHMPPQSPRDVLFYDGEYTVIGNLGSVFRELIAAMRDDGVEKRRVCHIFTQPTFLAVPCAAIPYVKVDSVSAEMEVGHTHELRRVQMESFGQWVLFQINSGRTQWFAKANE